MAIQPASLMETLDFNADDLAANHAGRVSERQAARLRRLRRRSVLIGGAVIAVIGFAAAVALFLSQRSSSTVLSLVGVGVTVCNAALTGVLARSWMRLSADISSGTVRELRGEARHTIRVTGRVAAYILKVDGESVDVGKPVFLAIRDGAQVRLYQSPAARVLLSGEIMGKDED